MQNLGIDSSKLILYNLSDDLLLFEQDADTETAIASLTKIMTAILTIENKDLNERVTITSEMVSGLEGYAVQGLMVRQVLSIEELLYATLLPSAADAAQALAIATSGSLENFAKLMNQKVAE